MSSFGSAQRLLDNHVCAVYFHIIFAEFIGLETSLIRD